MRKEPPDHSLYSSTYRPDLVVLFAEGGGSHHLILDLKFLDPLVASLSDIRPEGSRVAFGATHEAAAHKVLGRVGHGVPSDGNFDPSSGEGYVSPQTADYVDAITKGHTVVPLLFEAFGGFSPAAVRFFERMRDLVDNRLTHAQYEETTWSARSWMAFQTQKISVALQRAACLEIACDLGHAGALSAEAGAPSLG